jgi:hypothetical protein
MSTVRSKADQSDIKSPLKSSMKSPIKSPVHVSGSVHSSFDNNKLMSPVPLREFCDDRIEVKLPKYASHSIRSEGETFEFYKGNYFKKVATLQSWQSFGELALTRSAGTREATIKTETYTRFVTLDEE